jgi:hypothetical protein
VNSKQSVWHNLFTQTHRKEMRKKGGEASTFQELDPKVHSVILSFCDARALIHLLQVSKGWRRLAANQQLWRPLIEHDFPYAFPEVAPLEENKEMVDLEGNTKFVQSYPWVAEYARKAKSIRILKTETDKAQNLNQWYNDRQDLFCLGKMWFSNSHAGGVILPLFLFTVLLAVKMDNPGKYSWAVTFIPWYFFDFMIIAPLVSYWCFYLICPVTFKPTQEGGTFDLWAYRWNFILHSMHLFVPYRDKRATAWRIFNTLCLCMWVGFTITLPIALDGGSTSLLWVSYFLMICSGLYALFISKLIWDRVNTQNEGLYNAGDVGLAITPLWMVPGILVTGILWFIQWNYQSIGSYKNALIPFFISQGLMLCSPVTTNCLVKRVLWRAQQGQRINSEDIFAMTMMTCCILAPLITFEVLLMYHMDSSRFSAVIVFIPLWIMLGIAGCVGTFVFCVYISERSYDFRRIPDAFQEIPGGHAVFPINRGGW